MLIRCIKESNLDLLHYETGWNFSIILRHLVLRSPAAVTVVIDVYISNLFLQMMEGVTGVAIIQSAEQSET
jgi:hypothetical protein